MKTLNKFFIGYVIIFLTLMALTILSKDLDFLSNQQTDKIGSVAMIMMMGFMPVGCLQVLTAMYSLHITKSKKWVVYFISLIAFTILALGFQANLIPKNNVEHLLAILPCICYISYIITVFKVHKK